MNRNKTERLSSATTDEGENNRFPLLTSVVSFCFASYSSEMYKQINKNKNKCFRERVETSAMFSKDYF